VNSSRPYLLRAFYDWIVDNDCIPHILVDATQPGVVVPQQYIKDGEIVLNVSPNAAMSLQMTNERVMFNGRFGGQPMDVEVPVRAVKAIYARENGQGMAFEPEEPPEPPPTGGGDDDGADNGGGPGKRPALKIVK
jgi:stringent starvation protein B